MLGRIVETYSPPKKSCELLTKCFQKKKKMNKKNPKFSLTNNTNIDRFKKFPTLESGNSSLGIDKTMW